MRVIRMVDETPTVRTFYLARPGGEPVPFAFNAGQFLNLTLEIDGKRVSRSYTIASPPTREDHIELTIKREDRGHVSRFLHEMLKTGHTVTISGPNGRFSFDPAASQSLLLIAGGVGITPVMSILRNLMDINWGRPIDLVFSVRTLADVIFGEELRRLSAQHANLHVHVTVTRESEAKWSGPRGRITSDLLRQFIPDFSARPTFICGPDAMARDVRQQLLDAGVPDSQISVESFTPAAAVVTETVAGVSADVPTVTATEIARATFARSSQTASLSGGKSILEAAESVGVHIDFDCRSGICGQCRCKLLAGHVTMQVRDALSDADETDGFILACQAHATEDVTVDV
jgi:ferredoxin-NADP reductase